MAKSFFLLLFFLCVSCGSKDTEKVNHHGLTKKILAANAGTHILQPSTLPSNNNRHIGQSETANAVVDALISRIDSSKDLRGMAEFQRVKVRNGRLAFPWAGDDAHLQQFYDEGYRQSVPPDIRQKIVKAGGANVIVQDDCGYGLVNWFQIPPSYLNDDENPEGILWSAMIISAAKRTKLSPIPFDRLYTAFNQIGDNDDGGLRRANQVLEAVGRPPDDLPYVIVDQNEGCGAGELTVTIETDPPATRLRIIPEFFFSICENQRKDPWSDISCPWWRDALGGDAEMLAGTYRFYARTATGATRTGRFGVTDRQLDGKWMNQSPLKIKI